MVGRELLTLCPHGEDHQGKWMRGEGERRRGRSGSGENMTDLKSWKAMIIMGKELGDLLGTEFGSLVMIWVPGNMIEGV